jgi:hypothetical protein
MKLMTKIIEDKLVRNSKINQESGGESDFIPVVKFFGGGACTWLITEYDEESRMFFGLCDLGQGFPELGYVSRDELEAMRFPPFGLGVERDRYASFNFPLSIYAEDASKAGRITS